MVYEVIWTIKAINSYGGNIEYLKSEWSQKEAQNFISVVEKKLAILSLQPYIGIPASVKKSNIRYTILNKRMSLVYRVKPRNKQIELILFWNTYQNPAKLKI